MNFAIHSFYVPIRGAVDSATYTEFRLRGHMHTRHDTRLATDVNLGTENAQ